MIHPTLTGNRITPALGAIRAISRHLAAIVLGTLLGACVVAEGPGAYEDPGPAYGGGFYEPFGFEYGAWGEGYRVGPGRGGDHGGHGNRGAARGTPSTHSYRAAPAGHAVPSIPSGSGRRH